MLGESVVFLHAPSPFRKQIYTCALTVQNVFLTISLLILVKINVEPNILAT